MKLITTDTERTSMLPERSHLGETGSVRAGNSLVRLPYKSLDQVIEAMRDLIHRYKVHPTVRQKAVEVTNNIGKDPRTNLPDRRNHHAIADAIYEWAKKNVAYVNDPAGAELLQSPVKTILYEFGDCDDYTTLAASMLMALGIPVRLALSKNNPNNKGAYSHIYIEYEVNGKWHPFDLTLHSQAGQEVSDAMTFGRTSVSLDDCGCGCGGNCGKTKQDLGFVQSIPAILKALAATAGTAKGLGVNFGDLLGLNSRDKKRAKRDRYKQALIQAGVNPSKFGNWHSDEWKAGQDFNKIISQGGQLGVQFLNEKMGTKQQITTNYTKNLVRQFGPWLESKKASQNIITSSISNLFGKYTTLGYALAGASILGPGGFYLYKKYL